MGWDHVALPLVPRVSSANQDFNTEGFKGLATSRPIYLHYILLSGYNALWLDCDILPIKDPFLFLPPQEASYYDVVLTDDNGSWNKEEWCHHGVMCSCFIFLNTSPGAFWFLERWSYHMTRLNSTINQIPMNIALRDAWNATVYGSPSFVHLILPQRLFPSGELFDTYKDTAAWAHPNWRVGKANKKEFMNERGFWMAGNVEFSLADVKCN